MRPLIHVIDRDDAVRRSLCFLLRNGDYDVEAWTSITDFLNRSADAQCCCILLGDWIARPADGDAQKELMDQLDAPIIIVADEGDDQAVSRAVRDGVMDVLVKPVDRQVLLDAITDAWRDDQHSDIEQKSRREEAGRLAKLDFLEREVLAGMTSGLSRDAIAADLRISLQGLATLRWNVMRKLEVSSSAKAFRIALSDSK